MEAIRLDKSVADARAIGVDAAAQERSAELKFVEGEVWGKHDPGLGAGLLSEFRQGHLYDRHWAQSGYSIEALGAVRFDIAEAIGVSLDGRPDA